MNLDALRKQLTEKLAAVRAITEKAEATADEIGQAETLLDEIDALQGQIKTLERAAAAQQQAAQPAAHLNLPQTPGDAPKGSGRQAPAQAQFKNLWKYDNVDEGDLAFAISVLDEARRSGRSRKGASEDMRRALAVRVAEHKDPDRQYVEAKMAMRRAGMSLKANELNQSTLAGYGDEWVGVTYSTQMWERIRFDTPIVGMIPTIEVPQGSESVVIPLDGAPPTFYRIAQASAQDSNPGPITRTVPTSRRATGQQTLAVDKIGASTYYTGEVEEDSFLPWAQELRRSIEQEGAEVLESLVIDGDTETGATTNINDIGGTPAGNEYWLAANGFRKLALVTNTANARDGGTLAVTDFLETVKLMGLAGKNALDKDRVGVIVDAWTHWKSLELDEIKTRDVLAAPTLENGMLTNIYGYNVYPTGNMHRANQDATYGLKANAAGKIDLDTASNNTTGSILSVRFDQWRLGWKRRITFETVRVPSADSTEIVAIMRVGLVYRDTEAAAISYNIGL